MGCSSSIQATPPTAPAQATQQGAAKPQPVTPDSRVLRGQAYFAAGKVAEALKEFNATIATWPTCARAYLERGNVRLDLRDFSLAIGDYTMALQLQGNLIQAFMMRCHARLALRQYAEAMQDAREAERLDPDNAQVKALKAQVRKAQVGVVAVAGAGSGGPNAAPGGGGADEDDAFAGLDTPKSTPSPSVRKLCMVCMDAERECRLRPCMHAALCEACAEGLMARGYGCPICSSKIEQVERGSFMRTFTVEEAQGIVASARVVAPLASPGKSPLGRRVPAGLLPLGPSLDNIVEGDEEGHTAADAAVEAAAAAVLAAAVAEDASGPRRRLSSSSVASSSGRPQLPPPVVLNPYPLSGRMASGLALAAARWSSSGVEGGVSEEEPGRLPPPLPGEVVSQDGAEGARQRDRGNGDGTAQTPRVGSGASDRGYSSSGGGMDGSSRGSGGEATVGDQASGGAAAVAAVAPVASSNGQDNAPIDDDDDDGGGDVASPAALTAVASTYLANSLADWIDEHDGGGGGDSPARPTRLALPPVDETADAAAATAPPGEAADAAATAAASGEDADASGSDSQRQRHESFCGFASTSSARPTEAAGEIEPHAEADDDAPAPRVNADSSPDSGAGPAAEVGPVAEGCCSCPGSAAASAAGSPDHLVGRVVVHGVSVGAGPVHHHHHSMLARQQQQEEQQQQEQQQQEQQQQEQQRSHQRSHLCQQRTQPWSARSLVARAAAEAPAAAAAAAAAAGSRADAGAQRALAGTYASCGAAAAAARPFSRERTASARRGTATVAVAVAVPTAVAARPTRPPSRSGRRWDKRAGGGGGAAVGSGRGVSRDPAGLSQRHPASGGAVDVAQLPGAVPP